MTPTSTIVSRGVVVVVLLGLVAGCSAISDIPIEVEYETETTSEPVQVQVQYVVDGDTIVVVFPDGHEDTVRLLGVDTPEDGDTNPSEFEEVPDTEAGRTCLRTWSDRATAYLQDIVAGKTITLKFDAIADRRGYYDRLLAYVVLNNSTINRQLIAEGYARLYDSSFEAQMTYASLEQEAQSANRGVWQCQTV